MNKKLNYKKLLIANIIIFILFLLIISIIEGNYKINLIIILTYYLISVVFNLFILERR